MNKIEFINISKSYGKNFKIKNLNLNLDGGKIYGLLGPNGSGKTTIIKLLSGMIKPSKGKILINGEEISYKTRDNIAFLPDRDFLNPNMKIKSAMNLYYEFFSDFDIVKADIMLKNFGLNLNSPIKTLSKGNKEKLSIALTMCRNAMCYLLDEPIGGVDLGIRDSIISSIINNYNEDSIVLISTHIISEIEPILDEAILMNNGEIKLIDSIDNIRDTSNQSLDELFREVFKC